MHLFNYQAVDPSGREVRGTLKAENEQDLLKRLRSMGYYPVNVGHAAAALGAPASARLSFFSRKKATGAQVAAFTHQLASMLEAGVPLDRSLRLLRELEDSGRLKEIISDLLKGVQGGRSFAESLSRHGVFPAIFVNTVRAGEAGGALEASLKRMNAYLEDTERVKDEIKSALIYPLLLAMIGGAAVIFMLLFVVPRFAVLFEDLGGAAPLPALMLLEASRILSFYFWLLPAGLLLFWLGIKRFSATAEGRTRLDAAKLRLPLIGGILRKSSVARFSRTLGTLLQSGLPIMEALELSAKTAGNMALEKEIAPALDGVRKGMGVAGPLAATNAFPKLASHMISVGEETGRLGEMLLKLSDNYDREIKTSIKRALSTLEPAIILVMALIVGFIVVSVLLAVTSLNEIPM
ncbi:MAG: hypothetical protein A2054_05270 [Deltaproteobacteria bacterium GWA2_55_10]|nr:MAG: hypothetical protein A2054_05270 [Deltaproteobacteria bacterium GWA2_55_10]